MRVLVTGGKGKIASNIHSTENITFLKPGREELDLSSVNSILSYNEEIDGLIINGWKFHRDVFSQWGHLALDNGDWIEKLEWLPGVWQQNQMVNYTSNQILLRKHHTTLKFIMFFNTDTSNRKYHHYSNEKLMVNDLRYYLPDDILVKVDRAAMSNSLETRMPFLSKEVINIAWTIPFSFKINKFKTPKTRI